MNDTSSPRPQSYLVDVDPVNVGRWRGGAAIMFELLATLFVFGRLVGVQLRQTEGAFEWYESQSDEEK